MPKALFRLIGKAYSDLKSRNVFLYTAKTAYYALFSVFPFLMLVTMSAKMFFPERISRLSGYIERSFPGILDNLPDDFLDSLLSADVPFFSFTLLAMIWSASKWLRSLEDGLSAVYGRKKKRKWYFDYILSLAETLCFIFVSALSIGLMIYGNFSSAAFLRYSRWFIVTAFEGVLILLVYRITCGEYSSFELLPGALVSAVGMTVYSSVFSIYAEGYSDYGILYGSVGFLLLFMLWIYNCLLLIFFGAAVNVYLKNKPVVIE